MNLVFISPNFPPNYGNFCRALKEEGVAAGGIGDCDFYAMPHELRDSLAWYCRVDSLYHYNNVRDAFAYLQYRLGPVSRVESLNEAWLETEARLRTEFGLPGHTAESVLTLRRKSLMKKVFAAAGVSSARWEKLTSVEAALSFAARVGYPVIVKPDAGVGADDTHKFHSETELRSFHGFLSGRNYIIEEFMRGGIVTFDGLAGPGGEPVFYTSHVYGQAPMDALHGQQDVFYYSLRDLPPDLYLAGLRLLKGFGIINGFFHFEFFRGEDGVLSAMEINARPPGGMTVDMFNYSADTDCYRLWARLMAQKPIPYGWERKHFTAFASRRYFRRYQYSNDEFLSRFGSYVAYHGPMPEGFANAMGDYGYILRAPVLDEVLAAASALHRTV